MHLDTFLNVSEFVLFLLLHQVNWIHEEAKEAAAANPTNFLSKKQHLSSN